MNFEKIKLSVSSFLLFLSPIAYSKISNDVKASDQWLNLLDEGNYPESWNKADSSLKEQISMPKWVKAINSFRLPLGNALSRESIMSKKYSSLPGAPDGEYLVMKFKTEFQNKKESVETLTFNKSDKEWKVIGYYIN